MLKAAGPASPACSAPPRSGLQLLQRGPLGVPALHCGSAPSGFPLRRICYRSEAEEAVSFGWREVPPWLATKWSVLHFFAQYMQRWLQEVRSREGRGRVWISRGRGAVGHPHCRLGPCRPCLFCQGAPRQTSPGRPAWDLSLLHFAKSDEALLMLFSDGTLQVGGACPQPEWAGQGGWRRLGVSPEVKPPKGREVGLCKGRAKDAGGPS